MMKRILWAPLLLLGVSSVNAQPLQPANITTDPSTTPEAVQVLDQAGHWAPMGTLNSTTHIFTPVGGGITPPSASAWPLLATDTSVGMKSTVDGSFDNASKIPTLMSALGPVGSGYDVVFPGVLGQPVTTYYFSNTLELYRPARVRCAGMGSIGTTNSVQLVFAAGVDGVIADDSTTSPDGGSGGGGMLEACGITSLGHGGGYTAAGATQLVNVFQYGAPGSGFFATPWGVGDGILITPSRASFHPIADEPLAAHGAYVSAASLSSLWTLTLASGFQIANNFSVSNQYFIANTTHNFTAGDTITIGANTWTFVSGTPATGQIKVGVNMATSLASLASSIKTNAADPATISPQWGAPTTVPTNLRANATTDTIFGVPALSVTGLMGGAPGDAILASYAPAGTSAGSFDLNMFIPGPITNNFADGETITIGNTTVRFKTTMAAAGDVKLIANDIYDTLYNLSALFLYSCDGVTNCRAPTVGPDSRSRGVPTTRLGSSSWDMAFYSVVGGGPVVYAGTKVSFNSAAAFNDTHNHFAGGYGIDNVDIWKLPAALAYTGVTTTLGSASFTVTNGPRPLRQGDWIWSKDFVYGATVGSVGGTTFPQTVTMSNGFMSGNLNALSNDSGGKLWVIPVAYKRETFSATAYNTFNGFPNGLAVSCGGFVCGGNDIGNAYGGVMLGHITQGHNTAGGNSFGEITHVATLADVMEGGTLGGMYFGFNGNTNDNGNWNAIGNCQNQNYSMFLGGYQESLQPYCADPNNGLFPTTNSGNMPIFMGSSSGGGPVGVPGLNVGQGSQMAVRGGFTFSSGTSFCLNGGVFTFSSDNDCGTPYSWDLAWSAQYHAWLLIHPRSSGIAMVYAGANDPTGVPYIGYSGAPGAPGLIFPQGVILGSSEDGNWAVDPRVMCMQPSIPTGTWHKRGDLCFNTAAAHGSPMGWVDLSDGANFIPLANVP